MERVRLVRCMNASRFDTGSWTVEYVVHWCTYAGHRFHDGKWFHRTTVGNRVPQDKCPQRGVHGVLEELGGCGICNMKARIERLGGSSVPFSMRSVEVFHARRP